MSQAAARDRMDERVRERVDRFLADLALDPVAGQVLGVVVCGSAARGEEVWVGDQLASDIDLMLLTRRTSPRLTAAAEAVLARHRPAGIDGGPMPLGPLRSYATLLIYETRACGVLVSGQADLADLVPPLAAEDLPPWEGFRVLANRLLEHVKARVGQNSPERAVAKSYEALAEAHLVAEGRYRPTYAARLAELELRAPVGVPEAVTARMVATLRRRLDGGPAADADPGTAHGDLVDGLARLGACCTGVPGQAADQLALLARGRPHWRHRAYWSAVMLSQGRPRSIPLLVDPSIRIWQRALAAVAGPGDGSAGPSDLRLLDDWRRCPQVLERRRRPAR
jgi:hypothetical protein